MEHGRGNDFLDQTRQRQSQQQQQQQDHGHGQQFLQPAYHLNSPPQQQQSAEPHLQPFPNQPSNHSPQAVGGSVGGFGGIKVPICDNLINSYQMQQQQNADSFNYYAPPVHKQNICDRLCLKICQWPSFCCISPLVFCNYFGVIYTIGILSGISLADIFVLCPAYYDAETCVPYIWAGYFVIGQIFINFVLFHFYARYNQFKHLFPGKLKDSAPETKYCYTCKETVPIRAHHCPLCNICVYQKDHHCFLVGGCVGFSNQRYFVVFLFWAFIGATYGLYWLFIYLNRFMKPFFPWGWIDFIGPIALKKWIFFQHISLFHLALVLLFSGAVASMWGTLFFFASQIYFIGKGSTMWETMKRSSAAGNQLTILQRFRTIMGPWWLIQFIVPIPWLKNRMDQQTLACLFSAASKDL